MAKLAYTIIVSLGGESITLVPRLRHAIRLERIGFAKLTRDVLDGSMSAAVEIIKDHHDHPALDMHVLDTLDTLTGPLLDYLSACMVIDDDQPDTKAKGKTETLTFADHLQQLYRIGTGWLGWTPADTLDSTPTEIKEAYAGRMEMLKAMFGSGEQNAKLSKTPQTPEQRAVLLDFNMRRRARAQANKEV